ncbi:MAG: hypothetical protein M2R45_05213 [Verrucomicrobia subdivision 3 bacterium]|nr:hypothetical protein [Limisphaerales bacterium]MCS1413883.1 hypothetical protein [Limisphaerales bacterium]
MKVKAFNHLLGECGVTFSGKPNLIRGLKGWFPHNLDEARPSRPPTTPSLDVRFEHWFADQQIRPRIVAEFYHNALTKIFGREGAGIFTGPSAIAIERKVKHLAVIKITENARKNLFGKV